MEAKTNIPTNTTFGYGGDAESHRSHLPATGRPESCRQNSGPASPPIAQRCKVWTCLARTDRSRTTRVHVRHRPRSSYAKCTSCFRMEVSSRGLDDRWIPSGCAVIPEAGPSLNALSQRMVLGSSPRAHHADRRGPPEAGEREPPTHRTLPQACPKAQSWPGPGSTEPEFPEGALVLHTST